MISLTAGVISTNVWRAWVRDIQEKSSFFLSFLSKMYTYADILSCLFWFNCFSVRPALVLQPVKLLYLVLQGFYRGAGMVAALQAVKPEEWPIGQRIACPKCGREGKAGVSTFRAKGREYTYLVVNHADGRKCIVGRADKVVLQTVKPETEAEVARLREENARLREENRQLREAIARVYGARLVQAGPRERECLRLVAIQRKTGLPEDVRKTAWSTLHALAGDGSVDWVAVRLEEFERLRDYL
jgi:hypothetical protein